MISLGISRNALRRRPARECFYPCSLPVPVRRLYAVHCSPGAGSEWGVESQRFPEIDHGHDSSIGTCNRLRTISQRVNTAVQLVTGWLRWCWSVARG